MKNDHKPEKTREKRAAPWEQGMGCHQTGKVSLECQPSSAAAVLDGHLSLALCGRSEDVMWRLKEWGGKVQTWQGSLTLQIQ